MREVWNIEKKEVLKKEREESEVFESGELLFGGYTEDRNTINMLLTMCELSAFL